MEESQHVGAVTQLHALDNDFIAEHHSPSSRSIQKIEGVEELDNRLHSGDKDEVKAAIAVLKAKRSSEVSNKRWVNVTERVLHIWDLVYSDRDVGALVRSCVKATYVYNHIHIVFITLNDLDVVVMLLEWPRIERQGAFGCNVSNCLPAYPAQGHGVHIHQLGWYLFHCTKGVWVLLGLHLLQDESNMNGNKVTAMMVSQGVVVHQVLQSGACIICSPA